MKRPVIAASVVVALALMLAFAAAPANAAVRHPNFQARVLRCRPTNGRAAELNIVHGIPDLPVDIYVLKNFRATQKLRDVQFGTVADLNSAVPGFIDPGFYVIDVVKAGANPWRPLLLTSFFLAPGQSKSVVAYVRANAAGQPGRPALETFDNDLSSTGGASRVTVRHLAVAPTVGVYADGAVPITPAFSNGQTATAVVPAGSYDVTVTAPNTPTSVLADLGQVALPSNTNTLAFAIGTYPSTFTVKVLQLTTR